jgi:hypothetical protein
MILEYGTHICKEIRENGESSNARRDSYFRKDIFSGEEKAGTHQVPIITNLNNTDLWIYTQ